jgi:hypothetical protein
MSGNDLVRLWKDPDERGDAAHPSGDITLDALSGGVEGTDAVQLTVVTVVPMRCPPRSMLWLWCPEPNSFLAVICPFES